MSLHSWQASVRYRRSVRDYFTDRLFRVKTRKTWLVKNCMLSSQTFNTMFWKLKVNSWLKTLATHPVQNNFRIDFDLFLEKDLPNQANILQAVPEDDYACDSILKIYAIKKTEESFDLRASFCDPESQLHDVTIESLSLYQKWFTVQVSKESDDYGHELKLQVLGRFKSVRIVPDFFGVSSYQKLGENDKVTGKLRNYFMLSAPKNVYKNCTMALSSGDNRKCANLCPSYQGFSRTRFRYTDWTSCRVKAGEIHGYQYQFKNKCIEECEDWWSFSFEVCYSNHRISKVSVMKDPVLAWQPMWRRIHTDRWRSRVSE